MIVLRNVMFRYSREGPWVLEDLSLEIPSGQFVVLVGPNGSGKSTLAELVAGLLKPTSGKVMVNGRETTEAPPYARGAVGLVFQNPEHQFFHTKVEEDVAFGPQNLGLPPEEIKLRNEKVLREVGLWDLRHENPMRLSWGKKQLVAIAGILAMEPSCLILDEATSMLDPRSKRKVREVIREQRKKRGCTVIWITQDMEETVGAPRVVVLYEGKIAFDGGWRELMDLEGLLEKVGLERPTVIEVARHLETKGLMREASLIFSLCEELVSWGCSSQ